MKKITAGIVLTFICLTMVNAQFNTDSKMVGASSALNLGLSSSKYAESDIKTNNLYLYMNPRFGYFIDNMFAAGMDLGISTSRSKEGENDPTSYNSYLAGFFTRYYYQTAAPVVPFGEVNAGIGRSVSKYTDFTDEVQKTKHNILYAGAGAGAAFFVADNFALEGLLIYTYSRQKNTATDGKSNQHGVAVEFGFTFFFNSLLQK